MIEFNSNVRELVFTLLVTVCFFGMGLFLITCPHKAVSLLARWLRVYQRIFGLSDNDLDKTGFPIQRSILGGSVSRFAQTGTQRPEDFPAVAAYARAFGFLFALMCGLGLCLFLGLYILSLFVGRRP